MEPAPVCKKETIGFVEFVVLMAMLTALVALATNMVIPAMLEIGLDLGVERVNNNQLIISLVLLGMAVGEIFWGPLSDSIGRKPTIYMGLSLFAGGCLLSMLANSFQMMLIGRTLQGLGAAAPRIVVLTIIFDLYRDRAMARVMSLMMAVFLLVPIVAPAFGQVVLLTFHWRAIFVVYLMLVLILGIWFAWRQPETLSVDERIPFSLIRIGRAIREVVAHSRAFGYTIISGLMTGAYFGYLNSSQQLLQEQYGLGPLFPLYFAIFAIAFAAGLLVNARLVLRFGMCPLSFLALKTMIASSVIVLGIAIVTAGQPPLWSLTFYFLIMFFGMGILFGNLETLAMAPLSHIAGVGAAVVGSFSTFISVLLGTLIGQSYNDTTFPLIGGFTILSITSFGLMRWIETDAAKHK